MRKLFIFLLLGIFFLSFTSAEDNPYAHSCINTQEMQITPQTYEGIFEWYLTCQEKLDTICLAYDNTEVSNTCNYSNYTDTINQMNDTINNLTVQNNLLQVQVYNLQQQNKQLQFTIDRLNIENNRLIAQVKVLQGLLDICNNRVVKPVIQTIIKLPAIKLN